MARRNKYSAKKKHSPTSKKVTPEPPQSSSLSSSSSSSSKTDIETSTTKNANPPIVETKKTEKKKEVTTKKMTTRATSSVAKHEKETMNTPTTTMKSKTKQVSQTSSSKSKVTASAKKGKKDESSSLDSGSDSDSGSESSSSSSSDEEMPQAPAKDGDDNESEDSSKSGSESDDDSEGSDDDNDAMEVDDDKAKSDKNVGFTDENAKWLKPKNKQQLLSSEDDDEDEEDELNDARSTTSSSEESDTELLEVERQSRILDETLAQEAAEAEAELQHTIATQTATYHLPTPEELAGETSDTRVTSPTELRQRITDILHVLSSFTTRREPDRSRAEYMSVLSSSMSSLFGYLPELVDLFLTLFSPVETMTFLEANETQRPLVVRTNTLKTRRKDLAHALMKRGVTLDPLAKWSKVGLKITASPVPIGATPEYLAGYYMLQSAASLCPVMALDPQVTDKVLDMSSAPGGKTSFISQLMKNGGVVVANDLKEERQVATAANLQRLGCRNVVVKVGDGRKVTGAFDRVLLDAPCSGLGVIARDASVKVRRTVKDVERCAVLQKELLLNAIDCCRYKKVKGKGTKEGSKEKTVTGGIIVYSTCSISVQENEEVVDYVLKKRNVKLVDADLPFGKPGFTRYQNKRFSPSLALTRRFYPHVHNMDGFFVAKFQKLDHGPRLSKEEELEKIKQKEEMKEKAKNDDDAEVSTNETATKATTKRKKNKKSNRKNDDDDDADLTDDDASLDDNIKRLLKEGTISSSTATPTKTINADKKGGKHNTTMTRGKKRPSDNADNDNEQQANMTKTKVKRTKVLSVPPVKKTKKPSTNAKVTKPRRRKMVEDDGV